MAHPTIMLLCYSREAIKHGSLLSVRVCCASWLNLCCVSPNAGSNMKSMDELLPNAELSWVRLLSQLLFLSSFIVYCSLWQRALYHHRQSKSGYLGLMCWCELCESIKNSWVWAKSKELLLLPLYFFTLTGQNVFPSVAGLQWEYIYKQTTKTKGSKLF